MLGEVSLRSILGLHIRLERGVAKTLPLIKHCIKGLLLIRQEASVEQATEKTTKSFVPMIGSV